ncbi:hypothetical protein [Lentzea terrae]|uniref:hypothetical protein n=1 Tax=Lentzea terrae TaxID=2200761 RepID=UPI000DD37ED2|nr:hypothetical protein [Lentzea terrae]
MVDNRDVWRLARAKFGEMLSGLRRDADVTQDELAAMSKTGLRLSNQAFSDLERGIGARPPREDVVLFYLGHCLPRWRASAALREERRAGVLREFSTLVAMHERLKELDVKLHAPATNQDPAHYISNSVSGTVTGPVVQARDIHGDVHLSGTPQRQVEEPSDLTVAINSLHSMSGGWLHAFGRENTQVAESFAEELELPGGQASMDALFDRRLRAGAFVLSHPGLPACAVLSLFNPGSMHEVVVRDVLVTDKTDGPIVDGIAYLIEAGGMNDDPITFHLDSYFPVARLIENGIDKGRYFVSRHIRVAPGEHVMLPLKFDAEKSSHTFKLTVLYQVRGQQVSTVVDYHGQPFRISPTARSQVSAGYEAAYALTYDDSGALRLNALAVADLPPWLE